MPSKNSRDPSWEPALLLKSAAGLFIVLGGGTVVWGIDKWIRFPQARASQFGFKAPLWPAFTLFVLLATVVAVTLLWTAANRVERGADLHAQRHRRRPSSVDSTGENGSPEG